MLLNNKTIVITGSNKGIGYAMIERLAQDHPTYDLIMAVRTVSNGEEALKKLAQTNPEASKRVRVEELDISNSASIDKFVSRIGNIDVLVNNAAIAAKGGNFDAQVVQETFQTNFYGAIELSEKLIPNINRNGKIITVGSLTGNPSRLTSDQLRSSFNDPNLTKSQLFDLAKLFYDSVVDGTFTEKGFVRQDYVMSKLFLNTYNRVLSQQIEVQDKNIQVYSYCPGWCRTDMAGDKATYSAEEGADTCAYLVDLPFEINKDFQGQLFHQREIYYLDKLTIVFRENKFVCLPLNEGVEFKKCN